MKVTIKGDPKEIAALVVALQERREEVKINPGSVAQAICDKDQAIQEST